MKRDGYVFYRSFYEAVKGLDPKTFKDCIIAVSEYALNGTEEQSGAVANMFLAMAKPQIDANNKRYESGKRGGRPKKDHVVINTPEWYQKQQAGDIEEKEASEELKEQFEEMKKNVRV